MSPYFALAVAVVSLVVVVATGLYTRRQRILTQRAFDRAIAETNRLIALRAKRAREEFTRMEALRSISEDPHRGESK